MSNKKQQNYVKRFNKGFIISHWVNAGAFCLLLLSALPMYTEFFDWLYPVFGGPAGARLVHRIGAIAFILPLPILILFDRNGLRNWAKNLTSWKKHDFLFFVQFAKDFFGMKHKTPKQDFFNAGEKINSLLQIATAIALIGSGFIMWFADSFPQGLVMWAYPIHNISMFLAAAVAIAHIYMSIFMARPSMRGITKGDVTEDYAKDHHGRWYDEMQEQEENEKKKGKGMSA